MGDQRLSFTFHKLLGKGGFGEVYLATLTRPGGLSKRVAVKVLKEDLRNAEAAVQRLRDEGRMLAILDHPCILRVLEMTLIRARVALVTEYIDGIDLARCCRKGRLLPQSVVLGALGEVASALHCAWTTPSPETGKPLKLIHRDVKPENIRIGRHGEIKLLDFGIARTTEMFRHAKTAQGDLPFTPGYAAPEAFTRGFQGSASDIYALGVTMFRLLSGERLYDKMELSDQVTICCLPERYSPFLRERLTQVHAPEPVLHLLREMLDYEADRRPSAFEVEDRCSTLGAQIKGPSHVRWARAQVFPEATGLPNGSLTGQEIVEDPINPRKTQPTRGVQLTPRRGDATQGLLASPDTSGSAPRAQASQAQPPGVVADLAPPMTDRPPPPRPQLPPPPVPTGLQSVRPHTAPIRIPDGKKPGAPPPLPAKLNPSAPGIQSTLGSFVSPDPVAPPTSPPDFDSKSTLDVFTVKDDDLASLGLSRNGSEVETVERPPPKMSKPPAPSPARPAPMTAAPIEPPIRAPAPHSPFRWVGVLLAGTILLGGAMVMLGGLIAIGALLLR